MRAWPTGIGPGQDGSARNAHSDPLLFGGGTTNIGRAARPA